MVKHTACSSRGPKFYFQHPHVGLQPFITLVQGDPSFLAFLGTRHTHDAQICMYPKHTSTNKIYF